MSYEFEDILYQLTRYGGEPEAELLPMLDAITDINDDRNHDRTLEESLERLYEACDAFKESVKDKNFWSQFEPLTKHMFVGTLRIDPDRREVGISEDNGRCLYFRMDEVEFITQTETKDGFVQFLGQRVIATALVDKHCVRGILISVVPQEI